MTGMQNKVIEICRAFMNKLNYADNRRKAGRGKHGRMSIHIVIAALLFLLAAFQAEAGDKDRYTSKANSIFCINKPAIKELKKYTALRDERAISILFNKGSCSVSRASRVVYLVQEEEDLVRVQPAGTSKYLWTFRNSLW